MKKTILTLSAVAILSILTFVFGQGAASAPKKTGAMMGDTSTQARMGMHKMMGGMMGQNMVPTPDGGVVLLVGTRLYKYDRNLALSKQAEVQIDTASMRHFMDMWGSTKRQ